MPPPAPPPMPPPAPPPMPPPTPPPPTQPPPPTCDKNLFLTGGIDAPNRCKCAVGFDFIFDTAKKNLQSVTDAENPGCCQKPIPRPTPPPPTPPPSPPPPTPPPPTPP